MIINGFVETGLTHEYTCDIFHELYSSPSRSKSDWPNSGDPGMVGLTCATVKNVARGMPKNSTRWGYPQMTDMLVEYKNINVTAPVNYFMPEKQTRRGKHTNWKNEDGSICFGGISSRDYYCFLYRITEVFSILGCDLNRESLTANNIPDHIAKVVVVIHTGIPTMSIIDNPTNPLVAEYWANSRISDL